MRGLVAGTRLFGAAVGAFDRATQAYVVPTKPDSCFSDIDGHNVRDPSTISLQPDCNWTGGMFSLSLSESSLSRHFAAT